MPKIIYLTGVPGKSFTTRVLVERVPGRQVWEYGAQLTEHVKRRFDGVASQNDLRTQSAGAVTPDDVNEVDGALIAFVEEHRRRRHVLISSHPATKEACGYRMMPSSLARFARPAPDEIRVLCAAPEEMRRRIATDDRGRPEVTEEEARTHTALQSSVAATYGMSLGRSAERLA